MLILFIIYVIFVHFIAFMIIFRELSARKVFAIKNKKFLLYVSNTKNQSIFLGLLKLRIAERRCCEKNASQLNFKKKSLDIILVSQFT